jgi:PAS domain-containing protein
MQKINSDKLDETARKREISSKISKLVLENTNDLVAIQHISDLRYEYANPATLRLLGYKRMNLKL